MLSLIQLAFSMRIGMMGTMEGRFGASCRSNQSRGCMRFSMGFFSEGDKKGERLRRRLPNIVGSSAKSPGSSLGEMVLLR